MLRTTVLLKVDGATVQIIVVEGLGEGFGEYIHVEEVIHNPIDPVKFPNIMSGVGSQLFSFRQMFLRYYLSCYRYVRPVEARLLSSSALFDSVSLN
jgi:hypothetical protein